MQRSNYIVGRAFRNFLIASILTSVVQQLRVLMDGIIVSHLIGPMALSAVNLYLPLEETFYAIIMLFTAGAGFIAARRQSQHDYSGVSSQFTVALSSGICVVTLMVTLAFAFFPDLIDLLADEESPDLYAHTASYTQILLISFMIQVPNSVLRTFISLDGQPQLVTRSIIVSFFMNILLDVLLVGSMHMGMEGAAWATLASDMTGLFMLLPYATGQTCSFELIKVNHYAAEQRESLQEGFPLAIGGILGGMVILLTNQVVLNFEGANGVFIFAVIYQLLAICAMITEGLGEINESVGGVLLGENDNSSFRNLVHKCYKLLWGILLCMCLLILITPASFLWIFGAEPSQVTPENQQALRVASLIFLPYIMVSFNASVHTLVGYEVFSTLVLLLQSALMVSMPYLVTIIDPSLFWWAFPAGGLLAASVQLLVAHLIHRRDGLTTEIALLPTVPDNVSMDYSLPYNDEAIDESLKGAALFLNVCELDVMLRADLFGCCTDIAYQILKYSTDNREGHFFDLRIQDKEDMLEIRFKDAGKPFNPVQELLVPNQMEVKYKYMFGLNVTTLSIKKTREG